jgi:hypothetical protein
MFRKAVRGTSQGDGLVVGNMGGSRDFGAECPHVEKRFRGGGKTSNGWGAVDQNMQFKI